ncbi:MAG: tRNA (guanosine(46)-N7)-methyltransferase TrmB [Oscillospiraceae bacterium]|nr:tRNA (guanosine(46)-N7)-methyltransferase TrmB [Oscillospiraceae bacterium]
MRMRKKPNLLPRMERVSALRITELERFRGRWLETFPEYGALHLELGCGKGRFTAETAAASPDTLLLAVERVPDAMVVAMERAAAQDVRNVRFLDMDAAALPEIFSPGETARIYLNFCDPWPKNRYAKNRLTAPGFLRLYADALPPGGQVWFKTDNLPLFTWSETQFVAEGWQISERTNDLHAQVICGVMTDYEAKFHAQGVKINRLVATRTAETKRASADGAPPRLRNAALSDAKGLADRKIQQEQEGG